MGVAVFVQSIPVDYLVVLQPTCNVVQLTVGWHELAGDVQLDVGLRVGIYSSHKVFKILAREPGK